LREASSENQELSVDKVTLKVMPNPSTSGLFEIQVLGITSPLDSPIEVSVIDYLGKTVLKNQINTMTTTIDLSNLASGPYQLTVMGTTINLNTTLIYQR